MPAIGTGLTPIPQPAPPSPPPEPSAATTPSNISVRPADGLQGQLGLYEVTIDGATSYMTAQEVQDLEQTLESSPTAANDPTQQHGSDASRSGGLLGDDHHGSPLPAPTPLPGGGQTTQSGTGGTPPPAPPSSTP
jgi:hypothetical protein